MADTPLITGFFDQLGDHVADYGEGSDDEHKRRAGRRRRRHEEQGEVDPQPGAIAIPDADNRVGAIRIEKDMPILKELLAFVLNNKPGGWITPVEGVQVFLPTSFQPRLVLQQGNWVLDVSTTPVEVKVKKSVLGLVITYPTGLTGLAITPAGISVQLRNCPDLLVSPKN